MNKTAMIKGLNAAVCVAALGFSTAAAAGGTARVSTMSLSGKRVIANVDFVAPGNLRVAPLYGNGPTLMLRDGRAYSFYGANERPLTDLPGTNLAGVTRPNTGDEDIATLVSLKNTGKKENRAGFVCDLYQLKFYDRNGRRRNEPLAVSNDPHARELTEVWQSINQALMPTLAENSDLQAQLHANGLGLLRFGYRYQVDSFEASTPLPPVNSTAAAPAAEAMPGADLAMPTLPPAAETAASKTRKHTQGSLLGLIFGKG